MQKTATAPARSAVDAPPPEPARPAREAPSPLAGYTALYTARTPASEVALRHLSCLGAALKRTEEKDEEKGPTGPALRIAVPGTPGPVLSCHIGWSCDHVPGIVDETTAQAATGLMSVHGRRRGRPTRLPLDYASACAGVLAVHGVLASLIARERGTPISRADTSVTHAALLTVSQYLAAASAEEEEFLPADAPEAGPPFRSQDGVWFEIEALDPVPWRKFWTALGVPQEDIRHGWQPFVLRYPQAVCPLPASSHEPAASPVLDKAAGVYVIPPFKQPEAAFDVLG